MLMTEAKQIYISQIPESLKENLINHLRSFTWAWDLYYHVFRRIDKQLQTLTTLDLQFVSPELLECRNLELAVPGAYRADSPVVTITSFAPQLVVITSKQRPRKLTIHGSNGEDYAFLLKGHEDLRQDERVMQVREGGYDTKVNETVNVVTAKTTEIGQKTWGIMKGVVALATQKVEEYTKEGGASWKADGWQQNESERNGYYQEFSKDSKSSGGEQSSTGAHFNSVSSGSWDDWDHKDNKKEESTKGVVSSNGDGWAGWDDGKDDGFDNFYRSASSYTKAVGHNGKSDTKWSDGGFF